MVSATLSPTSKVAHPLTWGAVIGVRRQPYKAKPKAGLPKRVETLCELVISVTDVEEDYSEKKTGGSGG